MALLVASSPIISVSFPMPEGFSALTKRRAKMEQSNTTNPSEWESLGFGFLSVGAYCNAQKCFNLAEHFREISA